MREFLKSKDVDFIFLKNDKKLKKRLQKKLEEYRDRRNKTLKKGRYLDSSAADAVCKTAVLEILLQREMVNTFDLWNALKTKYAEDDTFRQKFINACVVIKLYASGLPGGTTGGTGF